MLEGLKKQRVNYDLIFIFSNICEENFLIEGLMYNEQCNCFLYQDDGAVITGVSLYSDDQ